MCNAASIYWNSIYKIFFLSLQAAGWSDITQLTYSSHQGPAMHVHAEQRQKLVLITIPTHCWECFSNHLLLHFKNKLFFQSNGNSTPKLQASNVSMKTKTWSCSNVQSQDCQHSSAPPAGLCWTTSCKNTHGCAAERFRAKLHENSSGLSKWKPGPTEVNGTPPLYVSQELGSELISSCFQDCSGAYFFGHAFFDLI